MNIIPLDPLNVYVAIGEIVLLMGGMAFLGWLLGRWAGSGPISELREEVSLLQAQMAELPDQEVYTEETPEAWTELVSVPDDLKRIEGIGPRIEALLKDDGITTFAQLAATSKEHLMALLQEGGPRFQIHDPTSWPAQAALARDGQWGELKAFQVRLLARTS
jgi:predicted flap endonuclease-1-like 5' DNA nuclease